MISFGETATCHAVIFLRLPAGSSNRPYVPEAAKPATMSPATLAATIPMALPVRLPLRGGGSTLMPHGYVTV